MQFPVYINLGLISIHPHLFFETLAYFLGFRIYLWTRNKNSMSPINSLWILIGAILGAAIGSKVLYWLESPSLFRENWNHLQFLMKGKTIVGGLLGGLIGVELTKKKIGMTQSTGDDIVFPLIIGMMIGRIGCFLTGLSDHTYGNPTVWFSGIDFGDGILRHPTQLYEIVFLMFLACALLILKRSQSNSKQSQQLKHGMLFQLFMVSYLLFRFWIDFYKPTPHPYYIFNNIQLACIAGIAYYTYINLKKEKEG
ncbi:prolipoprotein diacylglyceryl transferase [Chengkuizengella axinellae]|uniref:Prolipoprotein diacylglyceryl transferase n=1 Tax=Chengkuizengella axinellae TaxID=3064388 RepID=A0ABT9J686_9BACL|nr:prolipoprotein diacylglyceryl transferase family protein [Chengkuizengella sp. 2205SS18-9]MDP5276988.1 prolipoprotein diacylglyceryl transferase [Chengkuizengella sp. 2205SS18-9]